MGLAAVVPRMRPNNLSTKLSANLSMESSVLESGFAIACAMKACRQIMVTLCIICFLLLLHSEPKQTE